MREQLKKLWTKENALALAIAGVFVLLTILSSTDAPLWIYQGF